MNNNVWTFTAPCPGGVKAADPAISKSHIASLLGLAEEDLLQAPIWVDTGADQLLVPLASRDVLHRAAPDSSLLPQWPASSLGRRTAYLFVFDGDDPASGRQRARARYFFAKTASGIDEDHGTGSACANLGGWLLAQQQKLSARILVNQGEHMQRPCQPYLDVSEEGAIHVGGRVIEIGRGVVSI